MIEVKTKQEATALVPREKLLLIWVGATEVMRNSRFWNYFEG